MARYRHFSKSRNTLQIKKKPPKKREIPYWLQLIGTIGGVFTGIFSIWIGIVTIKLQRQANALASNDTLQRAQIDTLTRAVKELRTLNKQSLALNSQVVELINEARNQSNIALLSDEPQIRLLKTVTSEVKIMRGDDSSMFYDDANFNQTIVFKNYGRRAAIPKALYVYFFKIEPDPSVEDKLGHKSTFYKYLNIGRASTGTIDTTINYQEISPGDTLGYLLSTFVLGYWNGDELKNDYEVVKLIYQDPKDPIGKNKEKKFYFQYDSDVSVNFAIPKSVQNALERLTEKPPPSNKGSSDPFKGVIRPTR